jgi:hypothetical protein
VSDFLVNLARRSIGLGSMVEVRTDPAGALPRAPETGPADAAGRGAIAPGARDRIVEVAAPQIAAPPIAPPPGPERQALAIAALPAPVIQRLTLPMPAIAPAVPNIMAPAVSPAGGNDAQPPRLVPLSMGEPERPAAPPPLATATRAESAPAPSRTIEYHVQSIVGRAIAIPAAAEIAPRTPAPAATREDIEPAVRVIPDAPVVEHVIAPRMALVTTAEVPPAAPNRHNAFADRTEAAPPERTIHVRIGAIEINGAEPPPQAPASPPPQPAAVTPPGFDDFVHLRTYAPWAR